MSVLHSESEMSGGDAAQLFSGDSPEQQVLQLRELAGYLPLPDYGLIEVLGPDAAKYLQARLCNDVFALSSGEGQLNALLDRKAHVLAYFSLHRASEERFILLLERSQVAAVLEQIETYHFQEKLEYRLLPWELWTIQGGLAPLFGPAMDEYAITSSDTAGGESDLIIKRSFSGDTGYVYAFPKESFDARVSELVARAQALNMVPIGPQALNIARIEAGQPIFGIDFDNNTLLPETGLENVAASYSKGCYQGQEVLARIRTYGAPRRGLVGLRFPLSEHPGWNLDTPIMLGGAEAGTLASSTYSPTLGCEIALAYVQREYRVPGTQLDISIDDKRYEAVTVALPFYSADDRREKARTICDAALQEFTRGSEEAAISQLRAALKLDPLLADAYEALGVALSRQDQLEEAIALMKQLERLDPESIMAHANLSVFYMQQGNKELAEEEKAKAMSIRMSQMAREFADQKAKEEEDRKRRAEAEQRMSMFKQVLEIDPEDFLANAGMGSAFVDMERYEDAVPFLEKALAARPTHTVAYVSLAEALEKLGNTEGAMAVYRQGIAVAAQKGNLTPMKEMQKQLDRLSGSRPS